MFKFGGRSKGARVRIVLCGLLCATGLFAALDGATGCAAAKALRAYAFKLRQDERVDIRLRSFAPRASGQLTLEPSEEGGRARLTALRLPDPRTQSRDARTYVVWANSEGKIVRLGELSLDARGNGGLAFKHPGFERYTVIVTAEPSANVERPLGAPILSTRANEAAAVFPAAVPATGGAPTTAAASSSADSARPSSMSPVKSVKRRRGAGFYDEVEDALAAKGGGRLIELEGSEIAPRARGSARATERTGRAYVIVRFSEVPLPRAVNAGAYAMWAIQSNDRIVYMGSLPNDPALNNADIYVRVPGFDSDEFDLLVTAEQQRPVSTPSDRRALSTSNGLHTVR